MSGAEEAFRPAFAWMERAAALAGPAILAVDGRCGSGKTYLAHMAAERYGCAVVHMDDFYLPVAERAEDWQETPCANMDLTRLRREVLEPFRTGKQAVYRPYDCGGGAYGERLRLPSGGLLLVEGSYCHHPSLADLYDGKIFLTCDGGTQRRRLLAREGSRYPAFESTWIPLEERYIRAFSVGADCLVIDTSDKF